MHIPSLPTLRGHNGTDWKGWTHRDIACRAPNPKREGGGTGRHRGVGTPPLKNSYRDTRCDDSRIGTSDQPIRVPHQALKKAPGAGPTPCGTLESAAHAHRDSQ